MDSALPPPPGAHYHVAFACMFPLLEIKERNKGILELE